MENSEAVTIGKINFGVADGESEASDKKFVDLFYTKNESFTDIVCNPHTFIISGRKGTGKTILAKYVQYVLSSQDSALCTTINSCNVNLEILKQKGYEQLNEIEQQTFFKWYFLNQISKLILGEKIRISQLKSTGKIAKYFKLIKVKYYTKKLSTFLSRYYDIDSMFKVHTRSKGCSKSVEKGFNVDELHNILKAYTTNIPSINTHKTTVNSDSIQDDSIKKKYYEVLDTLSDIISKICNEVRIIILFDNFDEIADKVIPDRGVALSFIRMINAAKEINTSILMNQQDNNVYSKIVLCLRSDMINVLNKNSSNLNKYLADGEVLLYWGGKVEVPYDHILMDMIINKIKGSIPEYKSESNDKLYNKFFPEKVDGGKTVIQYLLDLSFERPRDIIMYLNIVKKSNPTATYFSATMLKNAFPTYAARFLAEVQNELSLYYSKEMIDDFFNLLAQFRKRIFSYSEINEYYLSQRERYVNITSTEEFLDIMYRFGILGNTWSQRQNGFKKYFFAWAYKFNGGDRVNMDVKFTVHYAIRKALSI